MKSNPANMKIISDLYCRNQEYNFVGEKDTNVDSNLLTQLYIIEKVKKPASLTQFSMEDARKLHVDFNNYHYWKCGEKEQEKKSPHNSEIYQKLWDAV